MVVFVEVSRTQMKWKRKNENKGDFKISSIVVTMWLDKLIIQ